MSVETVSDSHQLNEYVRDILKSHIQDTYTLDRSGQEIVIKANASLDEKYALAHFLPVSDACFEEIRSVLNEMPPAEYGSVLDVCAGTGYMTLNVMRRSLFKSCTALDINPEALKVLQQRAAKMGIQGCELRVGNIMATEFPSDTFDCIIGNSFLHHLPDNATFLREMHRILKPGGVICILGEPTPSSVKWQNYFQIFIKRMLGKRHGPKGEIPLTDIWQFSASSLTALLTRVGFRQTRLAGYGRWSAAFHTIIDRLWVRVTGRSAPAWIWNLAASARRLEGANTLSPDSMAALVISARKG